MIVKGSIVNQATQPVLAYSGPPVEVMFLKSLLESAGVDCSVDLPIWGENGVREARLFVAPTDVETAAPLVADFRENGTKSAT